MSKTYIIIQHHHAKAILDLVKKIDTLLWTLSLKRIEGKIDIKFILPLTIGISDLHNEIISELNKNIDELDLKMLNEKNKQHLKMVYKQKVFTKRLRISLKTSLGEELYQLVKTINQVCFIVPIYVLGGILSQEQGRIFLNKVEALIAKLNLAYLNMRKVMEHV